jgi:hypothetical protein
MRSVSSGLLMISRRPAGAQGCRSTSQVCCRCPSNRKILLGFGFLASPRENWNLEAASGKGFAKYTSAGKHWAALRLRLRLQLQLSCRQPCATQGLYFGERTDRRDLKDKLWYLLPADNCCRLGFSSGNLRNSTLRVSAWLHRRWCLH